MRTPAIGRYALVLASLLVTALALELVLRAGLVNPGLAGPARMAYDAELGWTPRPGRFEKSWRWTVLESGLRSHGKRAAVATTGRPVLAVGDSFTFGDEVDDDETWAAMLQDLLRKPVLNAGVGAYGIDQAVLRAERLIAAHHPDVVILSFISDDITRTEYAWYPYGRGAKPYFELVDSVLALRNVPVPEDLPPEGRSRLRRTLAHSRLAEFVLARAAHGWWRKPGTIRRVHADGNRVSVALLARLDAVAKARNAAFIAVAMATNDRIGNNDRLPAVIDGARARGVRVLDLATDTLRLEPDDLRTRFLRRGHYAPDMNRWVADRIAAFLINSGIAGDDESERATTRMPDIRATVPAD